jgi:hypothetical protein
VALDSKSLLIEFSAANNESQSYQTPPRYFRLAFFPVSSNRCEITCGFPSAPGDSTMASVLVTEKTSQPALPSGGRSRLSRHRRHPSRWLHQADQHHSDHQPNQVCFEALFHCVTFRHGVVMWSVARVA